MRFLWLIPDEFLVLVIALAGLGVMVGLVRIRVVGSLLGGIVLMVLLTPFIESFMDFLPWWLNLLLLVGLGWTLIRGLFRFVLGRGAADEMVGTLAADVVRAVLRGAFVTLLSPFRIIGWLLRRV